MEYYTERLILRPWAEEDAEALYQYASDPRVGPPAGWPVHTDVANSREIIRTVLSAPETYAVCLRQDGIAIGSIGLIPPGQSHAKMTEREIELGFWIGVPFWGMGLIPEAVRWMQRRAFEELDYTGMWCAYYDDNEKSRRCQEKCGFRFHHSEPGKPCPLMGDVRDEHYSYLSRADWRTQAQKPE